MGVGSHDVTVFRPETEWDATVIGVGVDRMDSRLGSGVRHGGHVGLTVEFGGGRRGLHPWRAARSAGRGDEATSRGASRAAG